MPTRPKPAFIGKIAIAARNNTLYWWEALASANLNATITEGEYWPDALATELQTRLNAASGATWTVSFNVETGKFSISSTTGFYPRTSPALTNNVLSGGHQDLAGNGLANGQVGYNHLGFEIRTSDRSQASSHTGELVAANCWIPDGHLGGRVAVDDEGNLDTFTADALAVDGTGVVLDFTPLADNASDTFLRGSFTQRQSLTFELLNRSSQDHFLLWFARTWAGRGKSFRYVPNRETAPTTHRLMRLTKESRDRLSRGTRERGYSLYQLSLTMERAAS